MELFEYHDKTLPRIVFREIIDRNKGQWQLTATLSRFGGLCVLVMKLDDNDMTCYQGDNICEARKWLDDFTDYE
jgi:hypothetical protein